MFIFCCNSYPYITIDTSAWVDSIPSTPKTVTISFYRDTADAIIALGASSFTSTSNVTIAACMANLAIQLNAAAAAHPTKNPQGLPIAIWNAGILTIHVFPCATPYNDNTPAAYCGEGLSTFTTSADEVLVLPAFNSAYISPLPVPIPCYGPPTIQGNPFACTKQQSSVTIVFPGGIPLTYTLTIPNGWTLVSKVTAAYDTLIVTVIPNDDNGVISVSYLNSVGNTYTATFQWVNDCYISKCASKLMLSRFCNDEDPCCIHCSEVKKKELEIERDNMNKCIALLNSYSMAKQKYYMECLTSDLTNLLIISHEIKKTLIRCSLCPEIQ